MPAPRLNLVTTYGPVPTPSCSSSGLFLAAGVIRIMLMSESRMGMGFLDSIRNVRSSTGTTVGNSGKKPATNEPWTCWYIFRAVATSSIGTGVPSE